MMLLGAESHIIRRFDGRPSVDDGGQVIRPDAVESSIQATICDAPYSAQQYIPEGVRGSRLIEIVSYSEIRAIKAGQYADHIIFDGATFEVQTCRRLPSFASERPHWEALATEVQPHRREG